MKVAIAILAAGASQRFDGIKQLALFNDKALLQRAVELASAHTAQPWVTLGANAQAIVETLDLSTARILEVPGWQEGMAASLRGIAEQAQREALDGVLILLADQPLLRSEDIDALLTRARLNPKAAIATRQKDGGPGVPAYVPALCFDELLQLKGDVGAKVILCQLNSELLDFGERVRDVDTREQLAALAHVHGI